MWVACVGCEDEACGVYSCFSHTFVAWLSTHKHTASHHTTSKTRCRVQAGRGINDAEQAVVLRPTFGPAHGSTTITTHLNLAARSLRVFAGNVPLNCSSSSSSSSSHGNATHCCHAAQNKRRRITTQCPSLCARSQTTSMPCITRCSPTMRLNPRIVGGRQMGRREEASPSPSVRVIGHRQHSAWCTLPLRPPSPPDDGPSEPNRLFVFEPVGWARTPRRRRNLAPLCRPSRRWRQLHTARRRAAHRAQRRRLSADEFDLPVRRSDWRDDLDVHVAHRDVRTVHGRRGAHPRDAQVAPRARLLRLGDEHAEPLELHEVRRAHAAPPREAAPPDGYAGRRLQRWFWGWWGRGSK